MKGLFSFFLIYDFLGGETHAPKSDARIPEDSAERDPLTASPPTEKIQLSTPVKSTVPRLMSRMRALSSSTRFPPLPDSPEFEKVPVRGESSARFDTLPDSAHFSGGYKFTIN